MTGISLLTQWPLTSPSHGSILKENNGSAFCYGSNSTPLPAKTDFLKLAQGLHQLRGHCPEAAHGHGQADGPVQAAAPQVGHSRRHEGHVGPRVAPGQPRGTHQDHLKLAGSTLH
jgi:hypothetical protein